MVFIIGQQVLHVQGSAQSPSVHKVHGAAVTCTTAGVSPASLWL